MYIWQAETCPMPCGWPGGTEGCLILPPHRLSRLLDRLNANLTLASPLGGHLWFPPGEQAAFFSPWVDGSISCGKLMQDGKLVPLETLQDRTGSFPYGLLAL